VLKHGPDWVFVMTDDRLSELEADVHDIAGAVKVLTLAVHQIAGGLSDAWLPVEQRERFMGELARQLPQIAEHLAEIEARLDAESGPATN